MILNPISYLYVVRRAWGKVCEQCLWYVQVLGHLCEGGIRVRTHLLIPAGRSPIFIISRHRINSTIVKIFYPNKGTFIFIKGATDAHSFHLNQNDCRIKDLFLFTLPYLYNYAILDTVRPNKCVSVFLYFYDHRIATAGFLLDTKTVYSTSLVNREYLTHNTCT